MLKILLMWRALDKEFLSKQHMMTSMLSVEDKFFLEIMDREVFMDN